MVVQKLATSDWEREIGLRLRLARKHANLTQAELAKRANLSLSALRALETGAGSSLSTLIRAMRALGLADNLNTMLAATASVSPMRSLTAKIKAERR